MHVVSIALFCLACQVLSSLNYRYIKTLMWVCKMCGSPKRERNLILQVKHVSCLRLNHRPWISRLWWSYLHLWLNCTKLECFAFIFRTNWVRSLKKLLKVSSLYSMRRINIGIWTGGLKPFALLTFMYSCRLVVLQLPRFFFKFFSYLLEELQVNSFQEPQISKQWNSIHLFGNVDKIVRWHRSWRKLHEH